MKKKKKCKTTWLNAGVLDKACDVLNVWPTFHPNNTLAPLISTAADILKINLFLFCHYSLTGCITGLFDEALSKK